MASRPRTDSERVSALESRTAVLESENKGLHKSIEETNDTLKSILESVNELKEDMARSKGFFAGMSFAYASLGMLVGAGIEYLLHK